MRGANGSGKDHAAAHARRADAPRGRRGALARGTRSATTTAREMLFLGHAPAVKDELTVLENLEFSERLAGLGP